MSLGKVNTTELGGMGCGAAMVVGEGDADAAWLAVLPKAAVTPTTIKIEAALT